MTCQQAKEMITDRCRKRERDLLALTRQMLRPVIGILTGHTQVQQLRDLVMTHFAVSAKRQLWVLPTFSATAITLQY